MSYKAGDLKLTAPTCGHPGCDGDNACWESGDKFWVRDARGKGRGDPMSQRTGAYLPHSCDEWYIGGADEVRAMISDLSAALIALEETSNE